MLGYTIAGRYAVTEHLAGKPAWGLYRATDREDGAGCLVSAGQLPRSAARLAEALALPALPGLAELRFHGPVALPNVDAYVVVEVEPAGAPLAATLGAATPEQAAGLVAGLARTVAEVHALGHALGGLHPRVVYADGGAFTGCAPRYARLHAAAATEWKPPLFEPTLGAPERLRDELAPTPASDVFTLAAILAWRSTGRPPFGATAMEEHRAHVFAPPSVPEVPAPLVAIVSTALARDPAARPTAAALADALARLAG